MKNSIYLLSFLLIVSLACSCKGKKAQNNPPEIKEEYFNDEVVELKSPLKEKIGSWAAMGKECYSVVVFITKEGTPVSGKTIKCKIVSMLSDKVKCKAMEKVAMEKESKSCKKSMIKVGSTWWETEGELWLTREEAQKHLNKMGL